MGENQKTKIIMFGAGGHAKVLIDVIRQQGRYHIDVIVDPITKLTELYGIPIRESSALLSSTMYIVAIGDNLVRKRIFEEAQSHGWSAITAIHPAAVVAPDVSIGAGTVIMAGAVINPAASVGKNCIINTGATIDHDCQISAHVHVAPGCNLAGNVALAEGAFLGIGARVIPNIQVGSWSKAGAGSVLIEDVPDNVTVVGSPARILRPRG
jgi:acetyltransferase EpsM